MASVSGGIFGPLHETHPTFPWIFLVQSFFLTVTCFQALKAQEEDLNLREDKLHQDDPIWMVEDGRKWRWILLKSPSTPKRYIKDTSNIPKAYKTYDKQIRRKSHCESFSVFNAWGGESDIEEFGRRNFGAKGEWSHEATEERRRVSSRRMIFYFSVNFVAAQVLEGHPW